MATSAISLGAYVANMNPNLHTYLRLERSIGKHFNIAHDYIAWGNGVKFPHTWANAVAKHGMKPMITWEPWDYTKGTNQPAFTLKSIIDGKHDLYISLWADAIRLYGKPIILRFAHEMNGNWYPWTEKVNGNHSGEYVEAWKHVYNIFVGKNVTNIQWSWCPYALGDDIAQYYPGDTYVDWLCMDGYNWGSNYPQYGGWQSFDAIFGETYIKLKEISNKSIMIGEIGSSEIGGKKSLWLKDAFGVRIPQMEIQAVVLFNIQKEQDWRVESSFSSLRAFRESVLRY